MKSRDLTARGYPFGLLKACVTAALTALALLGYAPSREFAADICVYGGTSAGISAAIAAAREGRSVALVVPTSHLGGMSTSGIGLADRGREETIGGIAREFYQLAGNHYGDEIAWRIEPSVATSVFRGMLAREPNILILLDAPLERVMVSERTIHSIEIAGGRKVAADVFIDATYEGDLMAAAGVSFAVGRESRNQYGESLAGIRSKTPKHQFSAFVDPYVRKGDPGSGLLPGISSEPAGPAGSADTSVQAYTFRLCVTKAPDRVLIKKPPDYDPRDYELLARHIVALATLGHKVRLRDLVQLDALPNGKFDLNNRGPFSTDLIGGSKRYPEASASERREIERLHENHVRGLFTFLQSDPRLPASLRHEAKSFGLARDEFTETGNWPPQLYVREARRMIGETVITQHDIESGAETADSIGLASYMIDSHNCRRIVVNGRAQNEGDLQIQTPQPCPIPYRAITPKDGDCRNLLVPVCLSASHVAFGSIRMEPVFMVLGQSAGIAATIAIKHSQTVQNIDIQELRLKLRSRGQVLEIGR